MKIHPSRKIVFLVPLKIEEKKKKSAIIIVPESADKREDSQAEVMFAGPECPVKVGDVVIYKAYDFHEVEVDGIKYLAGPVESILGTIK